MLVTDKVEMHGRRQKLKVFLAGPIQGYTKRQSYRHTLRDILSEHNVCFYDAWEEEGKRNQFAVQDWNTDKYYQKALELRQKRLAQIDDSDLIVAYLPKDSFGTACELSRAVEKKKKIVLICPMNQPSPWIVSITTPNLIYRSISGFKHATQNSGTLGLLHE